VSGNSSVGGGVLQDKLDRIGRRNAASLAVIITVSFAVNACVMFLATINLAVVVPLIGFEVILIVANFWSYVVQYSLAVASAEDG
jgi:hypothetical protein